MAGRVYHWKHGWIPLDHVAASEKRHGALNPVKQEHLPRAQHITVAHNGSKFLLRDKTTGHTATLSHKQAEAVHARGHAVTAVHGDGAVETKVDLAAAKAEAARKVAEAKAAEPRLTATMHTLAEQFRGKLAGLEFRLKGEDSLARKIAADVAESTPPPSPSAKAAAAKMFDVNRYTMVHQEKEYAQQVQSALDHLRSQGYILKVKNYWNVKSNPYKGTNVQVTAPDGHKFELQFHTPTSLKVKEGALHSLYEKRRVETDPTTAARLDAQMFAVANEIPNPAGVGNVA